MNKSSAAAVVLSAGLSTRMKFFKPLMDINGLSIVERAAAVFIQNNIDVYVVAGYRQTELEQYLKEKAVEINIVNNPDYKKGMFSSVQAGVREIEGRYSGFFLLPVDIPAVRPYTVKRLLDCHKKQPEIIFHPFYNGKRGHPPLIPSSLIPVILESPDEGGLKTVLSRFEDRAENVSVPDEFIRFDVDSKDQYETLKKRMSRYDIPVLEECEIILNDICHVETERIDHCFKVAEIAEIIGYALDEKGIKVDIDLIKKAAILHDIAKGERQHDITGGKWLKEMGFDRVAEIVSVHSFLPEIEEDYSLESKIVYLADKFVQGDILVTLDIRYQASIEKFGNDPRIAENILLRKQRAYQVKAELEQLIGRPLESVIKF
jgi:molybdenum cofactor cytidylyltransferase